MVVTVLPKEALVFHESLVLVLAMTVEVELRNGLRTVAYAGFFNGGFQRRHIVMT